MHPIPARETERIDALKSTYILDSEPDPTFDSVVALLRDLLDVPICAVSLMDTNQQWFKAKCGIDGKGTTRDTAFCSYAIISDEILVVEDMRCDARFSQNPFVTGAPHARFYAGAPLLIDEGIALGTLCAIGFEPRKLNTAERLMLERLAKVVVGLILGHQMRHNASQLIQETESQRRELQVKEQRFLQTERIAKVGGWDLDFTTNVIHWSDETYRIYGLQVGVPVDLALAISAYAPYERDRLKAAIDRLIDEGTPYDAEFDFITESGALKRVRTLGELESHAGAPKRIFGTFQDITEEHTIKGQLWRAANYDGLTGLINRNRFDEMMVSGSLDTTALLIADADHLKDVNDTLGHSAGDELLRVIACRLLKVAGPNRTVARIGGDEFAIIFHQPINPEALEDLANNIITAMKPSISFNEGNLKPTVSIGGAIRCAGQDAEGLRQAADLAIYHAKANRRGGYAFYRVAMKDAILARTFAIKTVDEALIEGQVKAFYQPVVELATGRISALEALARVRRGDAWCSIGEFAEALQDRRTATRITACMLERIKEDIIEWRRAGVVVPRIAVNVGPLDFQGDIESMIISTCERAHIEPAMFAMEVTESVFLSRNADRVSDVAARLRAHGIIVALDDFGTGHASLAHLDTFPVDVIKLDRTFIMRMSDGGRGAAIAASLIDLAQKLGIQVIAEGVETEAQVEQLIRLGCQKAQGYLFCRPMRPNDIRQLLLRGYPETHSTPSGYLDTRKIETSSIEVAV